MFMSSERKKRMSTGLDGTTVTVISKRKERTNWTATPVPPVDKNRFGQKILEKFGWSPGDGLGAQKQGIKEQLKPKVKSDNAGIGFKGSGEEWLKQQNDFSELLANLSGENMEVEEREISISTVKNSLELKSKKSRARVHYHKFTRGKDLSQYSSKDLAQILGPDTVYGRTSEKSSRDNVNHVNRGSMMDYFQKKDVLWDVYHKLDGERTQQTVKNKSELLLNDLPNDANNSDNIQCSGKKNRKTKNIISQREMSNSFLESSMSLVSDKQNYRKKKEKGKLISATNEDNFGNNSIFELKGNVMLVNSSNSTEKMPDSSEHNKKKRKNCKRNGINRNENSTNTDNNYLEEKDSCISSSKKKKVKRKNSYTCKETVVD